MRAIDGYDATNPAADAEGSLDALGEPTAAVVGIDGAPPTSEATIPAGTRICGDYTGYGRCRRLAAHSEALA